MWTATGLSDAGRDVEPAALSSGPFVERHDVSTPPMTSPDSTIPSPKTPLPSLLNEREPSVVPAADASARRLPSLPPPANREPVVKMVDAATECGL